MTLLNHFWEWLICPCKILKTISKGSWTVRTAMTYLFLKLLMPLDPLYPQITWTSPTIYEDSKQRADLQVNKIAIDQICLLWWCTGKDYFMCCDDRHLTPIKKQAFKSKRHSITLTWVRVHREAMFTKENAKAITVGASNAIRNESIPPHWAMRAPSTSWSWRRNPLSKKLY